MCVYFFVPFFYFSIPFLTEARIHWIHPGHCRFCKTSGPVEGFFLLQRERFSAHKDIPPSTSSMPVRMHVCTHNTTAARLFAPKSPRKPQMDFHSHQTLIPPHPSSTPCQQSLNWLKVSLHQKKKPPSSVFFMHYKILGRLISHLMSLSWSIPYVSFPPPCYLKKKKKKRDSCPEGLWKIITAWR